MGITRLADVTGLDYIGIPVIMACRPNSRALSVAQGKGLDLDAARTSGFMEAAETFHGEHIDLPVPVASRRTLAKDCRVVDLGIVPQSNDFAASDRTELPWIEAEDLLDGKPIWVPYDLIHTDCREVREHESSGDFPVCSNGLASGNNRLEAICAGLYEIIERDANALWALRPRAGRAATRLDLDTVDDPYCRTLIDRLAEARMMLSVWDMTSDVGVPAFFVRLREGPGNTRMPLGSFCGAGCHLARGIASGVTARRHGCGRRTTWHCRTSHTTGRNRCGLDIEHPMAFHHALPCHAANPADSVDRGGNKCRTRTI